MSAAVIHVLNGPNLNLLGTREPAIYGAATLDDVKAACASALNDTDYALLFAQTNSEGGLVDLLHAAGRTAAGVVLNAAAYTHTSVAVHDAVKAIGLPVVEVHLSNVHAREAFRHHSFIASACIGQISGFGVDSYALALRALVGHLVKRAAA